MTETATATPIEKAKAKKGAKPKSERKPRASNVAIEFAQKIEAAAQAKLDAACQSLREAVEREAANIGSTIGVTDFNAFLTVAVGPRVGVAKHNAVAAENKIKPGLTAKLLEAASIQ